MTFSDVSGSLISQEVMMLTETLELKGVFGCLQVLKKPKASKRWYRISLTNLLYSSEHSGF